MPNQHSPREREIERFNVSTPYHRAEPEGKWVRFEDHQATLQDREAELEDRIEELGQGLESWKRSAQRERARANQAEAALREALSVMEPFAIDGGVSCGSEEADALNETYERLAALDTSIEDREPGGCAREQAEDRDALATVEAAAIEARDRVEELEKALGRCGGSGWLHDGHMTHAGGKCRGCPDCKPPAPEKCKGCEGTGFLDAVRFGPTGAIERDRPCYYCNGTGTKPPAPCSDRGGDADESERARVLEERRQVVTGGEPEPGGGLAPDDFRGTHAPACELDEDHQEEAEQEPSSSDQEGEHWRDEGFPHLPLKNVRTVRATLHRTQPAVNEPPSPIESKGVVCPRCDGDGSVPKREPGQGMA